MAQHFGEFVHAEHEDSDIVRCAFNKLSDMIMKERKRLTEKVGNNFNRITWNKAVQSLSLTKEDKEKYNIICNKIFIKSIASNSSKKQIEDDDDIIDIKQYKYKCSECYKLLKESDIVFMCNHSNDHNKYILCPMCHGFIADQQIYHKIIKSMILINLSNNNLKQQYQLSLNHCLDKVNQNGTTHFHQILTDFSQSMCVIKEIYEIILIFFGKENVIKLANHTLLMKLLDCHWNLQCFITTGNVDDDWYKAQNRSIPWCVDTNFRLFKMNITINEYEDIKNDNMYKKYVLPNTKQIDWNGFKSLSLVKLLFDKSVETKYIGNILTILCEDESNGYKLDGVFMKLTDYSYDAHRYYPGGPPQCEGFGDCLIFKMNNDKDAKLYVVQSYQQEAIGM